MATRKPRMKHDAYCGGLTDELIDSILKIREMEEIPNFKNIAFNFPNELIVEALQNGKSVREYLKEKEIDANQYKIELRDYQTVGVGFMYLSPRSIIGDGVGRGKTVEISGLINVLKAKKQITRFIIAVEKSAQPQTLLELLSRTGLAVLSLPPEKAKMEKMVANIDWDKIDGIVINHSSLKSNYFLSWLSDYVEDLGDGIFRSTLFDTLIIDESSVLKNEKAIIYSHTKEICRLMKRIHFMNATVFETSIMDIYNQIDMLDETILPSKSRIRDNYCIQERKPYWVTVGKGADKKSEQKFSFELVGYQRQDEFKHRLRLFYLARHFEDTTNNYNIIEVYPTEKQTLAIQKGERYQEVLNCPSLIVDEKYKIPFTREEVPKLDVTIKLCDENRDKKIMIYCFYRDAQQVFKAELEKIGISSIILNGDINKTDDRQAVINEFNVGEAQVIITNVKKSLNLYNGDICIIVTLESNPAKLEQIRGRIDRHVDEKLKTYYMLVVKGTPEYRLYKDKLLKRGEQSKELTVDAKSAVDYFINGEIIQDFSGMEQQELPI